MSRDLFPIVGIDGNMITDGEGRKSVFFRLEDFDLEQYPVEERDSLISRQKSFLASLNEEYFFKILRLREKTYLSTNFESIGRFGGRELSSVHNPLNLLFNQGNLISDLRVLDDYINFNGEFVRVLSVKEFSDREMNEWEIPTEYDYLVSFKRLNKEKAIEKLGMVRRGQLSSFYKIQKDIVGEGAYSQAEELMESLIYGQESLFEMEMYFLLQANSLEKLNKMTFSIYSEMKSKGIILHVEGESFKKLKSGLLDCFNQFIPGTFPEFKYRMLLNKSSHLNMLIPLHHSELMTEGISFRDREHKEIFFNPFDKSFQNRNMLVTGASGLGKSVFVNRLVHELIDDHPCIILDKGGSFKRLTMYHNGVNLTEGICPTQFQNPFLLKEIILSQVDRERFGRFEQGKLLSLIKLNLTECSSFWDVVRELETDFPGLSYYFEESKEFFSGKRVEFQKILYVDLDNYPQSVLTPLILFLLEYFKCHPAKEKILVFDECWSYLQGHGGFVEECFRTFRKTGAFPIAISQSVEDFSGTQNGLGRAIANNSYFKVFFPQDISRDESLEEFDKDLISQLSFAKGEFSEFLIKTQDNRIRKIARNVLNPLEYELSHTEKGRDHHFYRFLEQNRQYFDSNSEAIDAFVRLKHG